MLPRSTDLPRGARRVFAPWDDPAARPLVRFDGLVKRFGDATAVDALTLDIFEGEFFALLGPSGCGKTTLLRLLAGFETPDAGCVLLDDKDLARMPAHRRPVNKMFQSYALFPHLTVAGNIAFGLKQEGLPKDQIAARVAAMLALVKLDGYGARKPHQLSGGQRQRVALARALVKRPRVLLLDEPLAALDKKLRGETQFELMHLRETLGLTFIIVTHDQGEAMTMADRIGVMNQGRLEQVATPPDLYEQPVSRWIASFVGEVNLIEGRALEAGGALVDSALGVPLRARSAAGVAVGDTICIALRPEKMQVTHERPATSDNCVAGEVSDIAYLGDMSFYKVRLDNGFIMRAAAANVTREHRIGWHDRVWASFASDAGAVLTR